MTSDQQDFLAAKSYAVAGASSDRQKYGNIVFRALVELTESDSDRKVYPLNPKAAEIEGHAAFADLSDLPEVPEALSIVTPPAVTAQVVRAAIEAGVKMIWMQPGAENDEAVQSAEAAGITVIAGGPCVLVALKTLV